jgi:hypothetical protein
MNRVRPSAARLAKRRHYDPPRLSPEEPHSFKSLLLQVAGCARRIHTSPRKTHHSAERGARQK